MNLYKVLHQQTYSVGEYSIVPIRLEDRFQIMKWRNEQMYHLRQSRPLTKSDQNNYFENVVSRIFEQAKPDQILFSFLKDDLCIGYGGLVHINWLDKNAEISFIMDTALENDFFESNWINFLTLIEKVAFEELNLHKIFTYAFDLRPRLYTALEKSNYRDVAELKEHCFYNGDFISVKIHSKFNDIVFLRNAKKSDLDVTYQWANNSTVRQFSYNTRKISKEDHSNWFLPKLNSKSFKYLILEVNGKAAGSIRFDIEGLSAKINYLIDPGFTGKGLGTIILKRGINKLKDEMPELEEVYGMVLRKNKASVRIFEKLNFSCDFENDTELKYVKELCE